MASNKLTVSEFDFDSVKANLKTFLKQQTEFQDFDFEGSGMSILLDLLAYNTHYLGFNANMMSNELYLDSADIRKNIVSLAKMIGYTPTSSRSPVADITIKVNNASGTSLTLLKGTTFETTVDGVNYTFLPNADVTITPSSGVYEFTNVKLYEGTLASFTYTVDSTDVDQKFVIPNRLVDTTTLKVTVQESAQDTTINTYTLATGYTNLSNISKAFFLQETSDGKFEIYFGDGVIGKKLADGNIVKIEYIISNAEAANGASSFSLKGSISGFSDVTVTVNSNAANGANIESKESIRYNAPLQYTAQDRAVTTKDYETLTKSIYPNALSVSAYGGEDDETPVYGTVKIAIKAASGSTLTETTKADIVSRLKTFNVASVTPVIVDPETTDILLTSNIKYDASATSLTADSIRTSIIATLQNYNSSVLNQFAGVFRYSKVIGEIDDTDNSIVSNITTLKIRKSFTPVLNTSSQYNIYFRNALYNPHSGHNAAAGGILSSTGFKIEGDTNEMFLNDDGAGNIRRFHYVSGVQTYDNLLQGTIDYTTGAIVINSLNIESVSNIRGAAATQPEITVTPNSNDIVPVRDQIINIDTANSSITVTADSFVGGSADAGVGYTTTSSY
tara:strand:- start:4863 stop:6716 length:1854 start_codon:yes stop_codon:yes gene_type:complete